jgi:hypothetical protein
MRFVSFGVCYFGYLRPRSDAVRDSAEGWNSPIHPICDLAIRPDAPPWIDCYHYQLDTEVAVNSEAGSVNHGWPEERRCKCGFQSAITVVITIARDAAGIK